jgi:hypothetical protein
MDCMQHALDDCHSQCAAYDQMVPAQNLIADLK